MNNFRTREISRQKETIGDYILGIILILIMFLGTLYAFGEEQRLAEEQGVSVNQLR